MAYPHRIIGMKLSIFKLAAVLAASLQFASCGDFLSSRYIAALPKAPESWVPLLGEPHWRLEWLDPGGKKQSADIFPGRNVEIDLPVTWANPVTAWPYWPGLNLGPGLFKPAGALFPFDVSGGYIHLSWKAGPDAVFYRELALANGENGSKFPANFDWPRFRELFDEGALNERARKDPWLVNWRSVAEKTIASNFDRRRLVPEVSESMTIPVPSGIWYGTSPFADPLHFAEDSIPVFQIRPNVDAWISAEGILRCNGKTWVFYEFTVK
jgi:hypothetical protein